MNAALVNNKVFLEKLYNILKEKIVSAFPVNSKRQKHLVISKFWNIYLTLKYPFSHNTCVEEAHHSKNTARIPQIL